MSVGAAVLLLCALACPVGMGVMMLFMRRSHGEDARQPPGEADERSD